MMDEVGKKIHHMKWSLSLTAESDIFLFQDTLGSISILIPWPQLDFFWLTVTILFRVISSFSRQLFSLKKCSQTTVCYHLLSTNDKQN